MAGGLIVEDNLDLREMYEEILSFAGHDVRSVETAAEAIAALDAQVPAVVLLDLGITGGAQSIVDEAAAVNRNALPEPGSVGVVVADGFLVGAEHEDGEDREAGALGDVGGVPDLV